MIDAIGYIAGLLAMISFLPQVVKTYRTKSAQDISLPMLQLTLTTNILYVLYGILLKLYPIVIMISIMSCIVIIQIVLTIKYRSNS
ncbi:SemiSWEET family sugar transporter [Spirochaetota bacterium]